MAAGTCDIADLRRVERKPPHLRLEGKFKIHTGPKFVVHSRLIQTDAERGSWHHQKDTANSGFAPRLNLLYRGRPRSPVEELLPGDHSRRRPEGLRTAVRDRD